jgi:hypothetical protein
MKVYVRVFVAHMTYVEDTYREVPGFIAIEKRPLPKPLEPLFPFAIGNNS